MFTGLIESVCAVKGVRKNSCGLVLSIDLGAVAKETREGDSIAINGVCLTVTGIKNNIADFDVSDETLQKSDMASLKPGCEVNIERALKASDRLAGHIVQGHVDGTATFEKAENKGQFRDLKFAAKKELLEQMVLKGSVSANGISLTIADINDKSFSVAIIPHTWEKTNLNKLKIGDKVNIETDIIVKTIKSHLKNMLSNGEKLTIDGLRSMGF